MDNLVSCLCLPMDSILQSIFLLPLKIDVGAFDNNSIILGAQQIA